MSPSLLQKNQSEKQIYIYWHDGERSELDCSSGLRTRSNYVSANDFEEAVMCVAVRYCPGRRQMLVCIHLRLQKCTIREHNFEEDSTCHLQWKCQFEKLSNATLDLIVEYGGIFRQANLALF